VKTKILGEKAVAVPLCQPQIPHELSWEQSWVSRVRWRVQHRHVVKDVNKRKKECGKKWMRRCSGRTQMGKLSYENNPYEWQHRKDDEQKHEPHYLQHWTLYYRPGHRK
jgi:hypothetical protein